MIARLRAWWNRTDREERHPQARELARYDVTVCRLTAAQAELLYDIVAERFGAHTLTGRAES